MQHQLFFRDVNRLRGGFSYYKPITAGWLSGLPKSFNVMAEEKMLPDSEELKETEETESEEEVAEEVEETVNLKKAEYDKLLEERDNYKKATLSLKKKPSEKSEVAPKSDDDAPVTKGEFYKSNEKQAITAATAADENDPEEIASVKAEINANWDSIVPFIHSTDRSTSDVIYDAILDGHAAWKRRQKPQAEGDKKVRSELSVTRGLGGKAPLKAKPERKKVLQTGKGMDSWYPESQ